MNSKKPILVTGIPRSGTSWVGRMISKAPFVRYVHEPFNISSRPCRCGIKFDLWFQYLPLEEMQNFQDHLQHTFFPAFNHIALSNLMTEVIQSRRIRPLLPYLQSYFPNRPLIKAPMAVYSAETLANMFDMDVVILIRHPAAVVSSYKELNWTHPFSHFLNQSELMERHLAPFRTEIEELVKNEYGIVDQIALLWKLIHFMINKFYKSQTEWAFIRYEDLVSDPVKGYQKIFAHLQLPFSNRIRLAIQDHHVPERSPEDTEPYSIKRNPNLVLSKWKKNLTSAEINRIRKRVEDISSAFYGDEDWDL